MGRQILNRISRLFHSTKSIDHTNIKNSNEFNVSKEDIFIDTCYENEKKPKKRWSTISKKMKHTNATIKDWFNEHPHFTSNTIEIRDIHHHHKHHYIPYVFYQHNQTREEHYDDEKVEVIVPSSSINSFLSETTKTSASIMPSFRFSSSSNLSYQNETHHIKPHDEEEDNNDVNDITPRTSIDQVEPMVIKHKSTVGLAILVNDILGDAFVIADHDFFEQERLRKEQQQSLETF